ncbi:lytic transglycosylase domain-containing protein [Aromatoleum toluclasticum]|uniref:lytic transglycosylase domain-containing protein n=1 Tax=Aromatoleum toluclasticum TaxID=92003 RepID=UPI001D17F098|nr:lytic transglycosylase domain-containing protein [Aromatoleum toluclasticum]MCC4114090.1 lytic transglycosylase domain-containing protein [Aromatoleum toluclasticum]
MAKGLWAALALVLAGLTQGAWGQIGDDRILAAREALRTGDRAALERLAAEREPHVLDPYVRYWRLTNVLARPEAPPVGELNEFLLREADSLLAERLRGDWLRHMAREYDWSGFLQVYADLREPDAELRCLQRNARLESGDMSVLDEVRARWMELADNHNACEPVFLTLAMAGHIGSDELWWRARRQIDSRSPSNARATISWMKAADAPFLGDFDRMMKSPSAWLDRLPANFAVSRAGRELALGALVRIAREDVSSAYARFARIEERLGTEERAYIHATLGHHGSLQGSPGATRWFRAAGKVPMSAEQRAWRVRAELRVEDWRGVQAAIEDLTAAEQAQPEWTYWLGRALTAQNRPVEAAALYQRIAGQPSFYGILAGEELGNAFAAPSRSGTVTAEDIARAEADPGLRRALALYRLEMRTEGMREWNWSLRGRDEGFLIAAARLALRNEIYDRAINTAERTDPQANFDLRFLTPYRQLIEPQVHQQGLDMAWVYGLMRQESRFIAPARSSSGAQGLMQVMPATGKWVARKIGLAGYHPGMLTDPDTNVLLGTSYMRLILEDLDDHPVLASAGYNAGPGRARKWRDERPLEGAIYAETIPFDETRDYVKKVMANAVIYAAMLEAKPQSLKARLGTISPRLTAEP